MLYYWKIAPHQIDKSVIFVSKCILDLPPREACKRTYIRCCEDPMSDNSNPRGAGSTKLMHYGMMACCAIMLLPVAGYFVAGGTIGGVWGNAAAFLPLLLCVGAHFVIHKVTGKSCHGASHAASKDEKSTKAVPLLTARRMEEPQVQGL